MGTLHHLPSDATAHRRLLQKLVAEAISQHPDKRVAEQWSRLAQETLARYPGPPLPSHPILDLSDVAGLSREQVQQVQAQCDLWLQNYFEDVRAQLMNVHSDFLKLQKAVAENQTG